MLTQALMFVVSTVLTFFIYSVLLRFYLQLFRAPYNHPFFKFVVALTDFLVKPLRRIIPGFRGWDMASLLLAWLLEFVLLYVTFYLQGAAAAQPGLSIAPALAFLAAVKLLTASIYILMAAVFIQAIMSWVNPYNPLTPLLNSLTAPFTRPVQKVVPPIANVDLSPLIVFFLAQLFLMVPIAWLESVAISLMR